ncbi:MAG: DNA-packaging protein [Hyphomonadaceae bacterium]
MTIRHAKAWLDDWSAWALDAQLEPPGEDWRTWLFLGGRGAGKTRAGAEWIKANALSGRFGRIALIAPTLHDAREVLVDGPSGLRRLSGDRPVYEVTRRRLLWASGAEAHCFSAEDPESLRGPQFDAAWGDEIAFWPRPDETLQTLAHGLRLGVRPLLLLTTTPRPIPALVALAGAKDTVITNATTWQNRANLAPGFIAALKARWTGSPRDRQELLGDLVEDHEGALWRREDIEAARLQGSAPPLSEIVVAVDPAMSAGAGADTVGVIAVGAYGEGLARRALVLADASVKGLQPQDWAARVAHVARVFGAHAVIAEANNGGELVRTLLRLAAPDAPIRLVHARHSKRERALPVAALYARGRVAHARVFAALEDEMCAFGAPGFSKSPDRLDALVWALTYLLLDKPQPKMTVL